MSSPGHGGSEPGNSRGEALAGAAFHGDSCCVPREAAGGTGVDPPAVGLSLEGQEPWGGGTWGRGAVVELLGSVGSGVSSSQDSVGRRKGEERGARGVLRVPALPCLSGPFAGGSSSFQATVAQIPAVGSGTKPGLLPAIPISFSTCRRLGFPGNQPGSCRSCLGLSSHSPVPCWRALEPWPRIWGWSTGGVEPLGSAVLPGAEVWEGDCFSFQAGTQLEARLGRQRFVTKSCGAVGATGQGCDGIAFFSQAGISTRDGF